MSLCFSYAGLHVVEYIASREKGGDGQTDMDGYGWRGYNDQRLYTIYLAAD